MNTVLLPKFWKLYLAIPTSIAAKAVLLNAVALSPIVPAPLVSLTK